MLYNLRRARLMFLAVSIVSILLAIWLSPSRLIPLGIMDLSLQSNNELTRSTALLEISLAKGAGFVIGAIFLVLFLLMPKITETSTFQAFMVRDLRYPEPYENRLTKVIDTALIVVLVLIAISLIYHVIGTDLFSSEWRRLMHREDGIIEYTSALLLIVAAGYAAYVGIAAKNIRLTPRLFHLFLALLFFAMCGEEISWGQRILGFETPENLSNLNVQNEVNLHNMFGYLFDHLFILLFFLWGCVIPLLFHTSVLNAQVIRWTGLPVPSIGLAIGMLFITLYQDKTVHLMFEDMPGLRIPEVRELFSAYAFLALMQQSRAGLVSR